MILTSNGFLPDGIIKTDLSELKRVFVDEQPFSATRKLIFDDYIAFIEQLQPITPTGFYQWINGSFVTSKRNPKDIDIVTFVNYLDFDKFNYEFEQLRKWRFDRTKKIDAYFVNVYPTEHPKRQFYEFDLKEWEFLFRQIRLSKQVKGFLELTF